MQAGSFDKLNIEAISQGRTQSGTLPSAGTAHVAHPSDVAGASVQLETTAAVQQAGGSNGLAKVRDEKLETPPKPALQIETPAEANAATSLELSSEAQRLALIPAQVMDTDEIAEARKQVTAAQEKVADAMIEQRSSQREATQTPASSSDPTSARTDQVIATNQIALASASHQTELTRAAVDVQESVRTQKESLAKEDSTAPNQAPANSQSGPTMAHQIASTSQERPDAMSALQTRSPFESSTPGAAGQSLDIVVGSDG